MCSQKRNYSGVLFDHVGKKSMSKLDQCCAIIVHMWFIAVVVRLWMGHFYKEFDKD